MSLLAQQALSEVVPNVLVHPSLAAVYRRKVEELESLLEDAEHKDEAMELICALIDKIGLAPNEGGGVDALLHGNLARILAICSTGAEVAKEAKQMHAVGVAGSRQAKTLAGFPYEGSHCRWLGRREHPSKRSEQNRFLGQER